MAGPEDRVVGKAKELEGKAKDKASDAADAIHGKGDK